MPNPSPRLLTAAALALIACPRAQDAKAPAQEPKAIAYPHKDALSPFRTPTDAYAPPDEVYRQLRIMQTYADAPGAAKSFDKDGREVIDDPRWREARTKALAAGVQAGYLASIMRLNRNADDRATAFYGAFLVPDVDHVFELIAHIPGEPARRTRERAMPRAIEFLRANLKRRFGDLDKEQQDAIAKALPQLGSPAAKAAGIVRAPLETDYLHKLTLAPFFQMLDLDEPIDQAQGLWFLKEVFAMRHDLALLWLEPALPRLDQLLRSPSAQVREQTIGLLQAIGPKNLREPPASADELAAWAYEASKELFPPIRNLNDAIVQLHPSPERDAIETAGVQALAAGAIGDTAAGERKDGSRYRGFRVLAVPDELKVLAIPATAVVTSVNGVAVTDAKTLLATVQKQLQIQLEQQQKRAKGATPSPPLPRTLFVEYVLHGESRAVEYRVM
jgi:hypothetical protein